MRNQENIITRDITNQALSYLLLGWSIIPVGFDKKPLIPWKEYQTKMPTEEDIIQWFEKDYPQCNIAVITGKVSNLTIVDIDPRHNGTSKDFDNIQTVKTSTGGGGSHIFFQYQSGVQNSAGVKEGVDIRSEGGYAILPPSKHVSGKVYEWIVPPGNGAIIADLPQFVCDWLHKNGNNAGSQSNWDKSVLTGVSAGERNDTAASVAGKLLVRFPEKEWNTEAWIHLLNWNSQCTPPLPERELRATFESIKKKERESTSYSRGTENPHGIEKIALIQDKLTYSEVEKKVLELLPQSEVALKLVLAVTVSAKYKNPVMIWLLLVGVPSSGKTEMVRLVKDSPSAYYLDNLTQNAFVSGERSTRNNKVFDLLPEIDKKCLIIKDWTSIFSLDEKMTKKLLGDLVGIYDKEFTKFSSRRGNISYSSAFSQLGCITPATLNKHTGYMNMVGPRFLCYTMPQTALDNLQKSYDFIFSNRDRSKIEKDARKYVSSYVEQLIKKEISTKPISERTKQYLRIAAELMSNCRGIVILQSASFKKEDGEEVKYYEVQDIQVEEPWRAVQQLLVLTKFLAFVIGKDEIGNDELEIIKEVVISSMPADRSQALRLIKSYGGLITAKQLAELSDKSTKTSRRLLDELSALKVLDKNKGEGSIPTDYCIAERFRDFIVCSPADFLSHNFENKNSKPEAIYNPAIPLRDQLKGKSDVEQEIITNLSWEDTVKELSVKNDGIPIT